MLFASIHLYGQAVTPGTTWQNAGFIQDGSTITGSYLNDDRLEDWFKIETPQDGTVTLIAVPQGTLLFGEVGLYNPNQEGTEAIVRKSLGASTEQGQKDTLTVINCKAGTYYIKVARRNYWMGGNGEGTYTLSYNFAPDPLPNDEEPNDTWTSVKRNIQNGETVTGHLGYYYYHGSPDMDGEDWYSIDVPADGTVKLTLEGTGTLVLNEIYLWTPNATGSNKDVRGHRADTLTVGNCMPGRYYVQVSRGTSWVIDNGNGSYRLHYDFTPNTIPNDPEPNNTREQAAELKAGETVTGHLGYLYYYGVQDIEDWYKITVTEPGPLFFECAPDSSSTLVMDGMTLYRPDGGWFANSVVNNGRFIITTNATEAGTWYLQVKRGGSWVIDNGFGSYTLSTEEWKRDAESIVRTDFIGNDNVRLGVPSEYTIKIENLAPHPSEKFFLLVYASDDVKLKGCKLPGSNGIREVSMDELSYDGDESMVFLVPQMSPYETYSFNIIAEGVRADNASARTVYEMNATDLGAPNRRVIITAGTFLVVAGMTVINYAGDKVTGFATEVIRDHIDLNEQELAYYRARVNSQVDKDLVVYEKTTGEKVVAGSKLVIKTVATSWMEVVPGGGIVSFFGELLETGKALSGALVRRWRFWTTKETDAHYKEWEKDYQTRMLDSRVGCNRVVSSWDPNEMCGPVGYGDENYIREMRTMNYVIKFENKAEATAPAYRIRISDVLDENVFDVSTVKFGSTSHDGNQYVWKTKREGNLLTWDIEGIELPPNVNAPEGEGYVTFSVDTKAGLPNLTKIKNKATIIFDVNDPIETNEYVNTYDLAAPTSQMVSAFAADGKITVSCQGNDGESGVDYYKFYYSTDGENFTLYDEGPSSESVFTIPDGKTAADCQFYAMAIDNVGNMQQTPPAPITTGITELANEKADNGSWTIYNLKGVSMSHGKSAVQQPLPAGVYIVRHGKTVRKIVVK